MSYGSVNIKEKRSDVKNEICSNNVIPFKKYHSLDDFNWWKYSQIIITTPQAQTNFEKYITAKDTTKQNSFLLPNIWEVQSLNSSNEHEKFLIPNEKDIISTKLRYSWMYHDTTKSHIPQRDQIGKEQFSSRLMSKIDNDDCSL